jgi:hypothetical protein
MNDAPAITLRCADPDEADALAFLAALERSSPPRPPTLVADLDGRLLAAISLADGAVVADPFEPTTALVELLRARARQLRSGSRPRRRRVRAWVRRRVSALA